jgi:hypothetical protein
MLIGARTWLCMLLACGIVSSSSGSTSAAQTVINACVNTTNGGVRIVSAGTACKNGEAPLQWGQGGGSNGLNVVDAAGVVVGPLVGTGGDEFTYAQSVVAVTVNNTKVAVVASPEGFAGVLQYLWFSSTDCTGQAYVYPGWNAFGGRSSLLEPSVGLLDPSTNAPYPTMHHYYGRTADVQSVSIGSLTSSYPFSAYCFPTSTGDAPVTPALPLDLTQFQPPLSIQ